MTSATRNRFDMTIFGLMVLFLAFSPAEERRVQASTPEVPPTEQIAVETVVAEPPAAVVVTPAPPAPLETETVVVEPPIQLPTAPVETPTAVPITVEAAPTETQGAVTEEFVVDAPTEVPPVTEVATDTAIPTVIPSPTPEPTAAAIATPSPTVAPSPTPEPTPVITWSQPDPVHCELRDGNPAGLSYGQSRTYRCSASTNVTSDLEMPTDMSIRWNVAIDFNGDTVQVGLPDAPDASIVGTTPGAHPGAKRVEISHPWNHDAASQSIAFDLTITRTTCVVGDQILTVDASPLIDTEVTGAEIKPSGESLDPAQFVSPANASEAPTVAFDGPITFEPLSATSSGLETNITTGSATLIVSGTWDPCDTWTLKLGGTVDVSAEAPAIMRVTSLNNELLTGGSCDLQTECDLIVLTATGSADSPLRYTVGLELQLHEFTPVGSVGINLRSELTGVETQP